MRLILTSKIKLPWLKFANKTESKNILISFDHQNHTSGNLSYVKLKYGKSIAYNQKYWKIFLLNVIQSLKVMFMKTKQCLKKMPGQLNEVKKLGSINLCML